MERLESAAENTDCWRSRELKAGEGHSDSMPTTLMLSRDCAGSMEITIPWPLAPDFLPPFGGVMAGSAPGEVAIAAKHKRRSQVGQARSKSPYPQCAHVGFLWPPQIQKLLVN